MSIYSEVRIDHFDDIKKEWCVDAWQTSDDNEEGVVVARICELTGNIRWIVPEAQYDPNVQEAIKDYIVRY